MSEDVDIKKAVDAVIVDSHEHLVNKSNGLKIEVDPLHLFLPCYLSSHLVSSGMTPHELNTTRSTKTPLEDR